MRKLNDKFLQMTDDRKFKELFNTVNVLSKEIVKLQDKIKQLKK